MPRRTNDVSRFVESSPKSFDMSVENRPETPQERQTRIHRAMQRAAETAGAIKENQNEHAHAENERLRRVYRRATSDLTLDMRDLMGGVGRLPPAELFPEERAGMSLPAGREFLTEQFPTNHDDMIMEDLYNYDGMAQPPRQVRQVQQQRPLREDMVPVQPRQQAPQLNLREQAASLETWTAKKYLGETRGGDTVPIWKVQNKKTGSAVDKLFRLESIAKRIAMMLNETGGDLNDPRVVSIVSAYDKRDKLLKEARVLEKTADGKQMKTERLRALRAEINQLEYRLGI